MGHVLDDYVFDNVANTSRKGEEDCTVWYDTFGEIKGIGPNAPDDTFCQSAHLRCDEKGLLPELRKGEEIHPLLGKVLEEVREYRESHSK